MRHFARIAIVLGLVALASGDPVARQAPARVVAIGDIHGAFDAFVDILGRAGLIDARRRWSGGRTTLVQTGDYTDRGAGVRAVFDLLMSLEKQAESAGGRAMILLGNHEVMNLVGEQRDVTPEIYATFADRRSEERRERAWQAYESLAAARGRVRPDLPEVYAQTRDAWMAAHPPGWLEYREALGPSGVYGKWLRKRAVSAQVAGSLFMHAGINPLGEDLDLDGVEKRVQSQIERVDRYLRRLVDARLALPFFTLNEMLQVAASEIRAVNALLESAKERGEQPDLRGVDVGLVREGADMLAIGEWDVLAPQGPLWYRGYATAPDDELEAPVAALLARYRLQRVVVAHSPLQARRILPRLGGSVVLIDTGMLASVYKGRASALEIVGAQLTAIYDDGRVPVTGTPSGGAAAAGAFEHQGQ